MGLIPSMIVAMVLGRSGINTLLVLSQVVLSFVLPFVVLPLVYITSSSKYMSARKDENGQISWHREDKELDSDSNIINTVGHLNKESRTDGETGPIETVNDDNKPPSLAGDVEPGLDAPEMVDFSNGKIIAGLGYFIWLIVLVANVYVLVTLAMGYDGCKSILCYSLSIC